MEHKYISRLLNYLDMTSPDFDYYLQDMIRQMKSELLFSFEPSDLIAFVFRTEYGVEGFDPPSHRREKTLEEAVKQAKYHRMSLMVQVDARQIPIQIESFRMGKF